MEDRPTHDEEEPRRDSESEEIDIREGYVLSPPPPLPPAPDRTKDQEPPDSGEEAADE
jgi:hypothetical protein